MPLARELYLLLACCEYCNSKKDMDIFVFNVVKDPYEDAGPQIFLKAF